MGLFLKLLPTKIIFYFGEALAPVTDTRQIRADTATVADVTFADSARTGCLQQTLTGKMAGMMP